MRNYSPDPSGSSAYLKSRKDYPDKVKDFAERLHSKLCRFGHEDQCTWYFEPDWTYHFHELYYSMAYELMDSGIPQAAIIDIIDVIRRTV